MKLIHKNRFFVFFLVFLYQAINLFFNWTETNTAIMFCGFLYAALTSLSFHLKEKISLEEAE